MYMNSSGTISITTSTGCTSSINMGIMYSSENIEILGNEIEFNYISNEKRIAIAMLNFQGYKFWHHLKKSGFTFGEEIDNKIWERVKILSRKEKLNKLTI